MIEPTAEMREVFRTVGDDYCDCNDCLDKRLSAVLAIVARDRCMEARGHANQPLARPKPRRKPNWRDVPGCMCARTGRPYRLCPVHGKDAKP